MLESGVVAGTYSLFHHRTQLIEALIAFGGLDAHLNRKRRHVWNRRFCLTSGMTIIKDHLKGQIFSR